ncbi:hypothetical protein IKE72_00850 [Candidatus Saccharibacteria bacterium]|nr:hypothetical protein [Candidatus Saccharibacteria bacterium]
MKNMKEKASLVVAVIAGFAIAMAFSLAITSLAKSAAALAPTDTETEPYPALAGYGSEEQQYPALAGFGSEYAERLEKDEENTLIPMPKAVIQDLETLSASLETETETKAVTETEAETEVMADTEVEEEPLVLPESEEKTRSEDYTDTTHLMTPGETIDPVCGVFQGPWLKETYYNLDMSYCIKIMQVHFGIDKSYWVRSDGVKMYGEYIMVAADTNVFPKGSIVETSLGTAMVVDHCEAAEWCPEFDIAVTW